MDCSQELSAQRISQKNLEEKIQGVEAQRIKSLESHQNLVKEGMKLQKKGQQMERRLFQERQTKLQLDQNEDSISERCQNFHEQYEVIKLKVEKQKEAFHQTSSRLYESQRRQAHYEDFEEVIQKLMLWEQSTASLASADSTVLTSPSKEDGKDDNTLSSPPAFKPLSEILKVEPAYEAPLAAILGPYLQTLIGSAPEHLFEAMDYLKKHQLGSAYFTSPSLSTATVPSSASFSPSSEPKVSSQEVKALLKEVVQYPSAYSALIDPFIQKAAVVHHLKDIPALKEKYPDWSFVDEEGNGQNKENFWIGGSKASTQILSRQREIETLAQQKHTQQRQLEMETQAFQKIEKSLKATREDKEKMGLSLLEQGMRLKELEKDFQVFQEKNLQHKEQMDQQEVDKKKALQTMNELQESLKTLKARNLFLEETKNQLLHREQESKKEQKSREQALEELNSLLKAKEAERLLQKEKYTHQLERKKNFEEQLQKLETKAKESQQKTKDLDLILYKEQLEKEEKILQGHLVQNESYENLFNEAKDQQQMQQNKIQEIERELQELQQKLYKEKEKKSELQLLCTEKKRLLKTLEEEGKEKYMCLLSQVMKTFSPSSSTHVELNSSLETLHARMKRIGNVNLLALEEYEKLKERYDFLNQQEKDLQQAKEKLEKVLSKIHSVCSRRFNETFHLANQQFQKIFTLLFSGGEAYLKLQESEEENLAGIEIIARPQGKKLQNIQLLSGGEKALTAVSLIFALFLVKPSPYCLLDEVDAPLDDQNVLRVNQLIKEMSLHSQMVVITHNKNTMKMADRLYGVTMQEKGVSRLLSVQLKNYHQESSLSYTSSLSSPSPSPPSSA